MTIRTQRQPTVYVETFDDKDRSEIHDIITELRQSYVERLHEATLEFHRTQRLVNRAGHEVSRLERHLERIDGFVKKHNIPLDEGKE